MKKCIIIIDPQKDFTQNNGFYALRHTNISLILEAKKNINDLLNKIKDDVLVLIVYSDYAENQFGENTSMCIPNTEGHEIDIIKKDKYLYFQKKDHSAFSEIDFKNFMKENSVKKIFIAGFLAEYCVKKTAIDALNNNIQIVLLKDCIGTGDDVKYRLYEVFDEIIELGGSILNYKDII
ncbi:MAG TPA: isochorismatase family cysteine hydrolase [Spirochaetota bacterium]|nr:isochorismatase family cysteine hydrolase [Spirochaetota bacterium]